MMRIKSKQAASLMELNNRIAHVWAI